MKMRRTILRLHFDHRQHCHASEERTLSFEAGSGVVSESATDELRRLLFACHRHVLSCMFGSLDPLAHAPYARSLRELLRILTFSNGSELPNTSNATPFSCLAPSTTIIIVPYASHGIV